MEKIPNQTPEKKSPKITEDSEYCIIDSGDKQQFIPKWKYIPVGGKQVRFEDVVRACTTYPDDNILEAIEKLKKDQKEQQEKK